MNFLPRTNENIVFFAVFARAVYINLQKVVGIFIFRRIGL